MMKINDSFGISMQHKDKAKHAGKPGVKTPKTDGLSQNATDSVMATAIPNKPEYIFDRYDNEYVAKPTEVSLTKGIFSTDDAPEKRVELHLHTKMSTMDATIEPSDAVKLAHAWGHKAVAITDHGNLQGYPDAMLTAESLGMKVIYGIEAYFVDNTAHAIYGDAKGDFQNAEFVIFDIETTGLSPTSCNITEIGAVIYKNGDVIDRFSISSTPGVPIHEPIAELAGTTDKTVTDAPTPEEAVKAFLAFAGDRILIAHDANFYIGFIEKVCKDNRILIKNSYLDTMSLTRYLNPKTKKYRLDSLREYYGITDSSHHSAIENAEMLGRIFKSMVQEMSHNGIDSLQGLMESTANFSYPIKLKPYHMILLVKNQTGLKNLYKLVSFSYLDHYARLPRIPKTLLQQYREGLLIGSACSEGELFQAILQEKPYEELLRIASFYDYLEVQPLGNNQHLLDNGIVQSNEKLEQINKTILSLADKNEIPCVATGDVHFMFRQDEIYRQILLAGMKSGDADCHIPLYMRTTKEMLEEFSYLPEARAKEIVITNPNRIADSVEEVRPIPKGVYPPSLEGAVKELDSTCYEKARAMYGNPLPPLVANRLEMELGAIKKHGFSALFVIAKRLVQNSESKGYLVGSRGSVGSSFVATMAGISEVNPLVPHYLCPNPECKFSESIEDSSVRSGFDLPAKKCPKCGTELLRDGHDIPFETLLGFFGNKSPDIDLNFSDDVWSAVHKYAEGLLGEDRVFGAGTLGTLTKTSAYGYVRKYLEENDCSVNHATESMLVAGCTGVKRTTCHLPGGIIAIPHNMDVFDFTPVQHSIGGSGAIITHFPFSYLRNTVLKIGILGHDIPTKYRMLEKLTNIGVLTVPMNDKKVMSLFNSSEALGCDLCEIGVETGTLCLPEFGTEFVRQILKGTKPKSFADLVQICGLSHGTDVWQGNARDFNNNNICSISEVIGTRDDIMTYLICHNMDKKMSYAIMEFVRKGKGLKPEWEEVMREHDVPDWYISSCKKIRYLFPKAHAAAYVISAIRLAWFKVYHPVEFYCTYFSTAPERVDMQLVMRGKEGIRQVLKDLESRSADFSQKEKATSDTMQIAFEVLSRGIEFLPVHPEKSDAKLFLPEDGKIRLPFISTSGLDENAAER